MLFCVSWEFTDRSEEGSRRSLTVFQNWRPAEGAEFRGFYGFADGGGGVAIIEAPDAATLARVMAPWTAWLKFDVRVILPIEESTGIASEAQAFLDSVA